MAPVNWLARVHVVITREGAVAYLKVTDPTGIVQLQQNVQIKRDAAFDDLSVLRAGQLQIWQGAGAVRTVYVRAAGHAAIQTLTEFIGGRGRLSLTNAMTKAQIDYAALRDQSDADGDSSITLIGSGTACGTVGVDTLQRLNDSAHAVYSQAGYNASASHDTLPEVPIF